MIVLVLAALSAACTKKAPEPAAQPASPEEAAALLFEKGRKSYLANCIACHNPNPKKDGAVGPAVADASLELLRLRVLDAKYPEGYKPKRATTAMAALPHLKDDIEALHAYLNSEKPK